MSLAVNFMQSLLFWSYFLSILSTAYIIYDDIGILEINDLNLDNNIGNYNIGNNNNYRRLMPGGFNSGDKQKMLNKHNELRSVTALGQTPNQPPASDMILVVWDTALENFAQSHVNKCEWEHSDPTERRKVYNTSLGENLWLGSGFDENIDTLLGGVTSWYNEHEYYTYNPLTYSDCESGKVCYHYTQLVWAQVLKIGCAYASCSTIGVGSGTWEDALYLSCNYYGQPYSGNIAGLYPYTNGSACSSCPSSKPYCSNGLCSSTLIIPTPPPTTTTTTTKVPTTKSPSTKAPTVNSPTTKFPTIRPTTKSPTTKSPTTKLPTKRPTKSPTTKLPTTKSPTIRPTTKSPTSTSQCCFGSIICSLLVGNLGLCASTPGCYVSSC